MARMPCASGKDIHIEVKPVNQAEDGLFAADNVVRREDCHCLLLFKVDLLFILGLTVTLFKAAIPITY
jgi:hypothetical protein